MRMRSAMAGSAAPPSVAATGPAAGAGIGTTGAGAAAIGATGAGAGAAAGAGGSAPDWLARRSSGRPRPLIMGVITGAITPMRTRTPTPIPLMAMAGTATGIPITDTEPAAAASESTAVPQRAPDALRGGGAGEVGGGEGTQRVADRVIDGREGGDRAGFAA